MIEAPAVPMASEVTSMPSTRNATLDRPRVADRPRTATRTSFCAEFWSKIKLGENLVISSRLPVPERCKVSKANGCHRQRQILQILFPFPGRDHDFFQLCPTLTWQADAGWNGEKSSTGCAGDKFAFEHVVPQKFRAKPEKRLKSK